MRLLSRIGRRVADVVARSVSRDGLFEQPGERPRQPPLPPRAVPAPEVEAAPAPEPAAKPAPEPEVEAAPAPEPAAKPAPEAEVEAAPAPEPEVEVEAAPAPKVEPEPEPEPAPEPPSAFEPTAPAASAAVTAALAAGGGPRLVNHWATWCDPCVDELPELVALHRAYGDRVRFLGLSWDLFDATGAPDRLARTVDEFADRHGIRWPSLLVTDPPDTFFAALALEWERIPQTWLVADDGTVVHRVHGVLTEAAIDELRGHLDALLEATT